MDRKLRLSTSALWEQMSREGCMRTYLNVTRAGNIAANFWEVARQPDVLVLSTGWGEVFSQDP